MSDSVWSLMKSDKIINQQKKIIDIGKTSSTGIFLETRQNERFILWRAKKEILTNQRDCLLVQNWFVVIFILPKVSSLKNSLSGRKWLHQMMNPRWNCVYPPILGGSKHFHRGFIIWCIQFHPHKELLYGKRGLFYHYD